MKQNIIKKRDIVLRIAAVITLLLISDGCARWKYGHYAYDKWVIEEIDTKIERLDINLTEEQKRRLDNLKTKVEERVRSRRDRVMAIVNSLKDETGKDVPNLEKFVADAKGVIDNEVDEMKEILDQFNSFYNGLDNTQKKKVALALKDGLGWCNYKFY